MAAFVGILCELSPILCKTNSVVPTILNYRIVQLYFNTRLCVFYIAKYVYICVVAIRVHIPANPFRAVSLYSNIEAFLFVTFKCNLLRILKLITFNCNFNTKLISFIYSKLQRIYRLIENN